jgi:hypothetical protein
MFLNMSFSCSTFASFVQMLSLSFPSGMSRSEDDIPRERCRPFIHNLPLKLCTSIRNSCIINFTFIAFHLF